MITTTAETHREEGQAAALDALCATARQLRVRSQAFAMRPVLEPDGRLMLARRADEGTPLPPNPRIAFPPTLADAGDDSARLARVRRDLAAAEAAMVPHQDLQSVSGSFSAPAFPLGWLTTTRSISIGWTGNEWLTSAAEVVIPAEHSTSGVQTAFEMQPQRFAKREGLLVALWYVRYKNTPPDLEPEERDRVLIGGIELDFITTSTMPFVTPSVTQSWSGGIGGTETQRWSPGVFVSPVAFCSAKEAVPRVMLTGRQSDHLASCGACQSGHYFWKPAFLAQIKPSPPGND